MATLKDIVADTGIPLNTVSRILAGKVTRIGARTAERIRLVEASAARLGYRVNVAARSMRSGRFGAIGLVTGTDRHGTWLPQALTSAITAALAKAGVRTVLLYLEEDRLSQEGYLPGFLAQRMCDALLVNHLIKMGPHLSATLGKAGIPLLWINHLGDGPAVIPDDRDAGRLAAEHLVGLGHRQIALLRMYPAGEPEDHHCVVHRLEGIRAVCRKAKVKLVEWRPQAEIEPRGRVAWCEAEAVRDPQSTGLITLGGADAMPLITALTRLGQAVPERRSVVTIGDSNTTHEFGLPLSRVLLPWPEVGKTTAEVMLAWMAGKAPAATISVPCGFMDGGTTGPAPR